MPQDYTSIGLNDRLQNVSSLAVRSNFVSSFDFDSNYDTNSISASKLQQSTIFTLGTFEANLNVTLGADTVVTIHAAANPANVDALKPMPILADLYIGTIDDDHVWNSANLGNSLTSDQLRTDFWYFSGQRENELNNNKLGVTYQLINNGTQSYDYFIRSRLLYVPVK